MEQKIKRGKFISKFLIFAVFAIITMGAIILTGCNSSDGPVPPTSSANINILK